MTFPGLIDRAVRLPGTPLGRHPLPGVRMRAVVQRLHPTHRLAAGADSEASLTLQRRPGGQPARYAPSYPGTLGSLAYRARQAL
jgi:hypothetical protein